MIRGDAARARRLACAAAVVWLAWSPALSAQIRVRRADDPGRAEIENSAPIDDLFRRAGDGVDRGDWKFTIDSLQRIIDEPRGALHSANDETFESARRVAIRRLAELPPEGQRTYHLLYDSAAAAQFDDAVRDHDVTALQRLVDRYLLTAVGDRAASTLASWLLDAGAPSQALGVLATVSELHPGSRLVDTEIPAKMALACLHLGWRDRAATLLQALRSRPDLDVAWRDRVERMTALIDDRSARAAPALDATRWGMANGSPGRGGVMPAAHPAFLDGLPWRYELPLRSAVPWNRIIEQQPHHPLLPTARLVADDTSLYFMADEYLVALDLVSLDPRWVAEPTPHPPGQPLAFVITRNRREPTADERSLARAVIDYLGDELSIVGDRIISLENVPPLQPRRRVIIRGQQPAQGPTRIVARDTRSGDIVWQVGGDESPESPLAEAIFAAAPVLAGHHLVAPYWQDKDIFVALLDPESGALRHRLHLCTLPQRPEQWYYPLQPAVDGHLVYVPTTGGLLFALDAAEPALLWASRYERARYTELQPDTLWAGIEQQPVQVRHAVQWLPSPPIIAGAVVLLAPPDGDQLVAFDRHAGGIRWRMDREGAHYLIAADGHSAWIGGGLLARVDLQSGLVMWREPIAHATGRAVLSGQRLYVPTQHALLAVDAASGELVEEQSYPADAVPLGNLLCWQGALFAIDSEQVRKFPDLEQSYRAALADFERRPHDMLTAVRLGWMELIRERFDAVLDILAPWPDPPRDHLGDQVVHLRVQALIHEADPASASAATRLARALDIARQPDDRYAAGLALADWHEQRGDLAAACRSLFELAGRMPGSAVVAVDTSLRRSAHRLIGERLQRLAEQMSPAALDALARALRPAVLDANDTHKRDTAIRQTLDDLMAYGVFEDWQGRAALKLGRWDVQLKKYERAEYYLRAAAAGGGPAGVEARERLAAMYLRDDLGLYHLAEAEVDALDAAPGADASTLATLRAEIAVQRQAVADAYHAGTPDGGAWKGRTLLAGNLLHCAAGGGGVHPDLVLMWEAPAIIAAYQVSTGRRVWESELRMLVETVAPGETNPVPIRALCNGRIDGQTLLLNSTAGIHALGLITGRRQWVEAFDTPAPNPVTSAEYFDIADGTVVLRRHSHRVDLLRAAGPLHAETHAPAPLWRAKIADFPVEHVRLLGDVVLLQSDRRTDALVLDRETGARRFSLSFSPPNEVMEDVATVAGSSICGVDGDRLVCHDLDAGRVRGAVQLGHLLPDARSIRTVADDAVLVGGDAGHLCVVRPSDGAVLLDDTYEFAPSGVYGGSSDGRTLYAWGRGDKSRSAEMHLAAVDLHSGHSRWINTELAQPHLLDGPLLGLPGFIPLFYGTTDEARVLFLDKENGNQNASQALPLSLQGTTARGTPGLRGDAQFWPGRMILGTVNGVEWIVIPTDVVGGAPSP